MSVAAKCSLACCIPFLDRKHLCQAQFTELRDQPGRRAATLTITASLRVRPAVTVCNSYGGLIFIVDTDPD